MSQQNSSRRGTRRLSEREIQTINREPQLQHDVSFQPQRDSSQEYVIHADVNLGAGGESEVYLATRVSDGERFAAKIYINMAVDQAKVKLRQEICELVMSHSDFKTWHLMPIIAHGVVRIPGDLGIEYPKFIEIMPLLTEENHLVQEGKAFTVKAIRDKWLPQLVTAVRTLHAEQWLHRDIKPENLFLIDGHLVLGDYGVCCKLLPDTRSIHVTTYHAGTPGYVAPEVTAGFAIQASDCYSLGSTLCTMCLGQHYADHPSVNCGNNYSIALHTLNSHLGQGKLPFTSGDPLFDQLLMGLLDVDTEQRYTLEDVENYCSQKNWTAPQVRRTNMLEAHFAGELFTDKLALAKAMSKKWEEAKIYLYRGGVNNSVLARAMGGADGLSQFTLDIIEKHGRDMDAGLTRLLFRMAPSLGICWQGVVYPDFSAIASLLEQGDKRAISLLACGVLSYPDIVAGDEAKTTRDGLAEAANRLSNETTAEAARWFGAFLLGHKPSGLYKKPDTYFRSVIRGKGDPARGLLSSPVDVKQLAWLRLHVGCDIWSLLENNKGSDAERLIIIYRFFEDNCEDKTMVREHYIRKGPHGHLAWLRDNLKLYTFEGKEANAIKNSIEKQRLLSKDPIANLEQQFVLLEGELAGFLKLFQGNLILAHMGYTCGKPILSTDVNAYFIRQRMGVDVPLGFMNELEKEG